MFEFSNPCKIMSKKKKNTTPNYSTFHCFDLKVYQKKNPGFWEFFFEVTFVAQRRKERKIAKYQNNNNVDDRINKSQK